jgi:hypothetical protein
MAREAIDAGLGWRKLEEWQAVSNQLAAGVGGAR